MSDEDYIWEGHLKVALAAPELLFDDQAKALFGRAPGEKVPKHLWSLLEIALLQNDLTPARLVLVGNIARFHGFHAFWSSSAAVGAIARMRAAGLDVPTARALMEYVFDAWTFTSEERSYDLRRFAESGILYLGTNNKALPSVCRSHTYEHAAIFEALMLELQPHIAELVPASYGTQQVSIKHDWMYDAEVPPPRSLRAIECDIKLMQRRAGKYWDEVLPRLHLFSDIIDPSSPQWQRANAPAECPVCLADCPPDSFQWACGHPLCTDCAFKLTQTSKPKCPLCRANLQTVPNEDF